jgi:hypothetical protein
MQQRLHSSGGCSWCDHPRMGKRWTLTLRDGPRIERIHFDELSAALEAIQTRMDELAPDAKRQASYLLGRRIDAARQVAVRGEISRRHGLLGSERGGIDLRGDGSTEAYIGRVPRRLIELGPGESAYDGLRRALGRD